MDGGLVVELWVAIVGSAAGVLAVAVAVLQLRRTPASDEARALPRSSGASLPAPTGRLPPVVRGRHALVDLLAGLVEAPDGRIHVLTGPGGIGKSTVALSLAERVRARGGGVWWLPAQERAVLVASFTILASELGATVDELEDVASGRRALADLVWTYLPHHRDWLLVLDNADDLGQLETGGRGAADGTGLLRPCDRGLTLVTSRTGDAELWGRHSAVHRLDPLDDEEGGRALLDIAPDAGTPAEARTLSRTLGGLPLALHHVGSYLTSPFAATRRFAAYGRSLDTEVAALLGRGSDERSVMRSTWNLSLHALERTGVGEAAALLRVLAMGAAPAPFPSRLFSLPAIAESCSPRPVERALSGLLSVGLIDREETGPSWTVSVHPLIAEAQRHTMTEREQRTALAHAVRTLHEAQQDLDVWSPADWPEWRELVPHLIATARRLGPSPEAAADLLVTALGRATEAMVTAGDIVLAEDLARRAHATVGTRSDGDVARITARLALGLVLRVSGRLDEAENALTPVERPDGEARPLVLRCRHQRALIDYARGDLPRAERSLREVLAELRAVCGLEDRNTRLAQFSLALVLRRRGDDRGVLTELDDFLGAWAGMMGPDHPYTLYARQERAFARFRLGELEEASRELRATLADQTRILGEDHHSTLTTRQSLAVLRAGQGERAEAERELNAVIEARRRLFGTRQIDTLDAERALRELRRTTE